MGEVFRASVPDFHWERFETWIEQIWETRDPQLLLQAPLCTAANVETPVVKQPCVVGDILLLPAPKPVADALPPKDKEELDGTRPVVDAAPPTCGVWKLAGAELDEVFDFSPEERACADEKVCCCELEFCCCTVDHTKPYKYKTKSGETRLRDPAAYVGTAEEHQDKPEGCASSGHKPLQSSVPAVVEAAAKLIPLVDEKGRRSRKGAEPEAPKTEKSAVGGKFSKDDPNTWTAPKQRDNQTPEEFSAYLREWERKRAYALKRIATQARAAARAGKAPK